MNKFREEYGRAVDELPELHMDAGRIQDELHHRRMQKLHRNRLLIKGGTAAAALLLFCGAGTAAAKNYGGSIIQVQDGGYTVTDAADVQKGGGNDLAVARSMAGNEDLGIEAYSEEEYGDGRLIEADIIDECEYGSLQEFLEGSAVTGRLPDIAFLQTEFEGETVCVLEDEMLIYVRVTAGDKFFCLNQFDHRESSGFASSTAYTGQTVNERNYTNSQGLNYIVFDTIGEDGQPEGTHAVISVEGRELSMDFYGFEAENINRVLSELDLTMYFSD